MKSLFKANGDKPKVSILTKRKSANSDVAKKVVVGDVPKKSKSNKNTAKPKLNISLISNVPKWFVRHWRGVLSTIILALLAFLTLSLELNTLLPGQNRFETQTVEQVKTLPIPWKEAVNAPYTIPAHFIGSFTGDYMQAARIVSVFYGLVSVALLFFILKRWFNVRIATVGSLLFMTSSWVLHITHNATPLILMVFGPLLVLAMLSWFIRTKLHKFVAFVLLMLSLAFSLYISYMPWMVLIVVIVLLTLERRNLNKLTKKQHVIGLGLAAAATIPLIVSMFINPEQYHALLGIPMSLPTLRDYFAQLFYTFSMLVFRSAPMPEIHLGTLPMLDIFSAAMLFLGIFYFAQRIKSHHSVVIFASLILFMLIIPLTQLYQLGTTILLPFVYLCIVAGIVELLNQWFTYFPRNPWARNFGVAMLVVAIGFASFYHLQRYFVAWPNSTETKSVYIVVVKK